MSAFTALDERWYTATCVPCNTGAQAFPQSGRRDIWASDHEKRGHQVLRGTLAVRRTYDEPAPADQESVEAPPEERGSYFACREEAATFLAGWAQKASPRYAGSRGVELLLTQPGTVEHAYRAAQRANPNGGPTYLAKLTEAWQLLDTDSVGVAERDTEPLPPVPPVVDTINARIKRTLAEDAPAGLPTQEVGAAYARAHRALLSVLSVCDMARNGRRHLFVSPDLIEDRMLAALNDGRNV